LAYLLAAAEFGIGLLSLGAARLRDRSAIRLIAWSFAAFHAVTAALEIVYLMSEGTNSVLIGNLVIRIVATGLFVLIARVRV
jgi:hypothetical protein